MSQCELTFEPFQLIQSAKRGLDFTSEHLANFQAKAPLQFRAPQRLSPLRHFFRRRFVCGMRASHFNSLVYSQVLFKYFISFFFFGVVKTNLICETTRFRSHTWEPFKFFRDFRRQLLPQAIVFRTEIMRQCKKSKANAPNANEWIPFCVYSFNGFYYFIIQPYDFTYIRSSNIFLVACANVFLAINYYAGRGSRIVYEMRCQTRNKNHHRLSLETDGKKYNNITYEVSARCRYQRMSCHEANTEI